MKNASEISRSCQNFPRPTFFEVPFATPSGGTTSGDHLGYRLLRSSIRVQSKIAWEESAQIEGSFKNHCPTILIFDLKFRDKDSFEGILITVFQSESHTAFLTLQLYPTINI